MRREASRPAGDHSRRESPSDSGDHRRGIDDLAVNPMGAGDTQPGSRAGAMVPGTVAVAMCQRLIPAPPETFPVVHRTGVATFRVVEVARREGEVLLCDRSHHGDHSWPSGDLVPAAGPPGHQHRP